MSAAETDLLAQSSRARQAHRAARARPRSTRERCDRCLCPRGTRSCARRGGSSPRVRHGARCHSCDCTHPCRLPAIRGARACECCSLPAPPRRDRDPASGRHRHDRRPECTLRPRLLCSDSNRRRAHRCRRAVRSARTDRIDQRTPRAARRARARSRAPAGGSLAGRRGDVRTSRKRATADRARRARSRRVRRGGGRARAQRSRYLECHDYDRAANRVLASVSATGADATAEAIAQAIREWRAGVEPTPITRRPAFWIAVGSAVAAGAATVYLLARDTRHDLVFE